MRDGLYLDKDKDIVVTQGDKRGAFSKGVAEALVKSAPHSPLNVWEKVFKPKFLIPMEVL